MTVASSIHTEKILMLGDLQVGLHLVLEAVAALGALHGNRTTAETTLEEEEDDDDLEEEGDEEEEEEEKEMNRNEKKGGEGVVVGVYQQRYKRLDRYRWSP